MVLYCQTGWASKDLTIHATTTELPNNNTDHRPTTHNRKPQQKTSQRTQQRGRSAEQLWLPLMALSTFALDKKKCEEIKEEKGKVKIGWGYALKIHTRTLQWQNHERTLKNMEQDQRKFFIVLRNLLFVASAPCERGTTLVFKMAFWGTFL